MNDVPKEAIAVVALLQHEGFEAHLVGGCVRDILMHRTPKDWDVTTNATPEDIVRIFPNTFYENDYGTVGVVNEDTEDPKLKVIEVTPYRIEGKYSDKRHPDTVTYAKTLAEDLKRRDFTMNAIAYDPLSGTFSDPHKGTQDIEDKIIRTVGEARERFTEDALRSCVQYVLLQSLILNWTNQQKAQSANLATHSKILRQNALVMNSPSCMMSPHPRKGIELFYELGILKQIAP